jgi:hypothetical protein
LLDLRHCLIQDGGLFDIDFTIQPADGSASKIAHLLAVLETDAQGHARSVLGFVHKPGGRMSRCH